MSANRTFVVIILLTAGLLSSCQDRATLDSERAEAADSSEVPPFNLSLKEIMRGLEADLAELQHGVWLGDQALISAAADRIADHPRIPPDQVAMVQEALTSEFSTFVQMDRAVHDRAVALASDARSSRPVAELFAASLRLQEGCFACHVTFQDRVSVALATVDNQ